MKTNDSVQAILIFTFPWLPAKGTLQLINPDVVFETHNYNITTTDAYDKFTEALSTGSVASPGSPVHLVLSCVDNFEARGTVLLRTCSFFTRFRLPITFFITQLSSNVTFCDPLPVQLR